MQLYIQGMKFVDFKVILQSWAAYWLENSSEPVLPRGFEETFLWKPVFVTASPSISDNCA